MGAYLLPKETILFKLIVVVKYVSGKTCVIGVPRDITLSGEDAVIGDRKQTLMNSIPVLRSGEWSDIGERPYMEDTHICVGDVSKEFEYKLISEEADSFYGGGPGNGFGGPSNGPFQRQALSSIWISDNREVKPPSLQMYFT